MNHHFVYVIAFAAILLSCNKTGSAPAVSSPVPEIYKKIYSATSITSDVNFVTIKT